MQYRPFGRLGWPVSEIGYGMWGLAGWTGSDDDETSAALERAVQLGCNFFDTAWAYGNGHSEQLLGRLVRNHPDKELYVATKVPPKNFKWPSRREFTLDECFPPDHIRAYAENSLRNLDLPRMDLLQFHVWEDQWAHDERWQRAVEDLKRQGLIRGVGVSVNRWEPANVVETLRTGLVDAVQVIYNIFDQSPEDELFPVCRELNVAVIARVPFDEGTLTGNLTKTTPLAAGRLAQQLFCARKPVPERGPGRRHPAARARRDDDARTCLAVDPGRAGGRDDHSRHAQGQARGGEPVRQRWTAARRDLARAAQRAPVGPDADGLVAVNVKPCDVRS